MFEKVNKTLMFGLLATAAVFVTATGAVPAFASSANTDCNGGNGINVQVCPSVNACVAAQVGVLAVQGQGTKC